MKGRKILATLISLAMIAGSIPVTALAEEQVPETSEVEEQIEETQDEEAPEEVPEEVPEDKEEEVQEQIPEEPTEPSEEPVKTVTSTVPKYNDGNSSITTWAELKSAVVNAENGDTITLTDDITGSGSDTMISVYTDKDTGKTITVDLAGHQINMNRTSANADGHVFHVASNCTLTLKSTGGRGVIKGGYANNGGGINNKGDLTVSNIDIINNNIANNAGNRGGGIYNSGILTLNSCTVDHNTGTDGGGIYNDNGGAIFLNNTEVTNNVALRNGGGGITNYGDAFVIGSKVTGNTAKGSGGGIWSKKELSVTSKSVISGNTSSANGGGICINAGTLVLRESDVNDNTASNAGGIYIENTTATATLSDGCTISGNTSEDYGSGGVGNHGTFNVSDNVTITGNSCKGCGGGFWNNGTLNVKDGLVIKDNTSAAGADNLFLKSGKIITIKGDVSSSEMYVSGEDVPRTITSGWGTYMGSTSPKNIIKSEDAVADNIEVADGEVTYVIYFIGYNDDGSKHTFTTKSNVRSFTSNTTKLESDCYYVVNKTLTNTNRISIGASSHLILCDGFTLTLTKGINASSSGRLDIYGQKHNTGKLIATAESDNAAIGSNDENTNGLIFIHGGTINATGGKYGAGIGTGDEPGSNGGKITIYGGDVTAQGGQEAAGIGGGNEGTVSQVVILGGKVTATGGLYGAGIGGGDEGGLGTVTIKDGNVTVKGGKLAAGIGGGGATNCGGTIDISGGTVKATSGGCASAIGSGAFQGFIGGGDFTGKIIISGGTVEAYSAGDNLDGGRKYGGAAIGSGYGGDMMGTITISGGKVTAYGSHGSAGIGAGSANGGAQYGNCPGTVNISGGDLYIKHGEQGDLASTSEYVGHGRVATESAVINIANNLMVCLEGEDPVAASERVAKLRSFNHEETSREDIPYLRVTACDHGEASYTVTETDHTLVCPFCLYTVTGAHDGAPCSVCGYEGAKWVVTFDGNGGTGTMDPVSVIQKDGGSRITLPECGFTAPEGKVFKAWLKNDTEFDEGDEVVIEGDTTVTAVWENAYQINTAPSVNGSITADKSQARIGEKVTLTLTPDPGYKTEIVKYDDTVIVPVGGVYSFTVPEGTTGAITVSAVFASYSDVDYVDETGADQTAEGVIAITSGMTELTSNWYVVDSDVTLTDLTIIGDVKIILADGKTITINGMVTGEAGSTLTLYGQTNGTGAFCDGEDYNSGTLIDTSGDINIYGGELKSSDGKGCVITSTGTVNIARGSVMLKNSSSTDGALTCAELNVTGGFLKAQGLTGYGISCSGKISVSGGTVNVTAGSQTNGITTDALEITGGTFSCKDQKGVVANSASFSWTSSDDSIYVKKLNLPENVMLTLVKPFVSGSTVFMNGQTAPSAINGKTLTPFGGEAFVAGHSLTLDEGLLGLNFYVFEPSAEESTMEFAITGAGEVIPGSGYKTVDGYRVYTCYVTSIQMADMITATYTCDGNTITDEYSVAMYLGYFDQHTAEYSAETIDLVHAIADYGHYAQIALKERNGWTFDDYAEMTDYYAQSFDYIEIYGSINDDASVTKGDGVAKVTTQLRLDSAVRMDINIYVKDGVTSFDCPGAEDVGGGCYRVTVEGIDATELGDMTDIMGTAGGSAFDISLSPLTYIKSVLADSSFSLSTKNAVSAFYKYYEATQAYK